MLLASSSHLSEKPDLTLFLAVKLLKWLIKNYLINDDFNYNDCNDDDDNSNNNNNNNKAQ
jgi:hypothetical protein